MHISTLRLYRTWRFVVPPVEYNQQTGGLFKVSVSKKRKLFYLSYGLDETLYFFFAIFIFSFPLSHTRLKPIHIHVHIRPWCPRDDLNSL